MRYVVAVLIPLLLQCLFVFILIESNTGNGSFVGLGAFLIGMFAIPATAIVNGIYAWKNKNLGTAALIPRSFLIAALVPVLTVILTVIG